MSVGVVVMAYGTPSGPEELEEYYTHIRRGRPPEAEQLADLRRRYDAIGGISPLAGRTTAQVGAIAAHLEAAEPGRFEVRLGQKHAAPFVEDAVAELLGEGVQCVVGLVLAPHFSTGSVGQYHVRAEAATATRSIPFVGIHSWHLLPELVAFQAAAVQRALVDMPDSTKVVFTAHSLPERMLEDDPYPDQLHHSAQVVADLAGLVPWAGWGLAWQSAGRTAEAWRGPDILEVIPELAETGRSDGILVVPQGFTSEHLEVLYDLDIEARAAAESFGLAFARTDVIDDDPSVMAGLARLVQAGADQIIST